MRCLRPIPTLFRCMAAMLATLAMLAYLKYVYSESAVGMQVFLLFAANYIIILLSSIGNELNERLRLLGASVEGDSDYGSEL